MLIESILGQRSKDTAKKQTDKATAFHGPVRESENPMAERDSVAPSKWAKENYGCETDELGTTLLSKRYVTPEAKALGAPQDLEVAAMLALYAEAHKHEPFKPIAPTALEMYIAKHGRMPDGIQHSEASIASVTPRLARGTAELFWLCLKIAEYNAEYSK